MTEALRIQHELDTTLRERIKEIEAELKRREDLRTRPVPGHDGIYMSSKRMWSPLLIREAGQWYLASRREPLSDDGYQRFVLEAEDLVRLQRNDGLRMTYDLGGYV